jgi:hypothetical protein
VARGSALQLCLFVFSFFTRGCLILMIFLSSDIWRRHAEQRKSGVVSGVWVYFATWSLLDLAYLLTLFSTIRPTWRTILTEVDRVASFLPSQWWLNGRFQITTILLRVPEPS